MGDKFEILEDEATADIAYLAHGESLEELYENAAFGLFSIITDPDKVREMQTDLVSVAAEDREALLLDFLNELLYLWDVEKVLFSEFSCEIREDGELEISAECSGEKFDPERHEAKVEVKAVTYFGMEVTEEDGIWKAKVTLDT